MAKIDVDAGLEGFLRSSVTYGVSRAGKTVFNATFPRPAIFASEREGGYKSIQTMDRSLWYEPEHKPIIYGVSGIRDLLPHFKEVIALAQKGRVHTIVLELSFYSEDVIRGVPGDNGWAKYKLLGDHIAWLDSAAKKLGVRIAYNALAAEGGDAASKSPGGILAAGKALARSLPASADLTGYLRTEDRGGNQGTVDRVLHLVPYGVYPAGHRYGNRLPSIVRNPTYRKLEDLLAGRAWADDQGNVNYGPRPDAPPVAATPPQTAPDASSLQELQLDDLIPQ